MKNNKFTVLAAASIMSISLSATVLAQPMNMAYNYAVNAQGQAIGQVNHMQNNYAAYGYNQNMYMTANNQQASQMNQQQVTAKMTNIAQIEAAIAELDDDDTQEELEDLLSTYKSALSTLKSVLADDDADEDDIEDAQDAVDSAESALLAALKSAGVADANATIDNVAPYIQQYAAYQKMYKQNMMQNYGKQYMNQLAYQYATNINMLDTTMIENIISSIDDDDTQEELEDLLETYESCLAAEKALYEDDDADEDDIEDAQEATAAAAKALMTALQEAMEDED